MTITLFILTTTLTPAEITNDDYIIKNEVNDYAHLLTDEQTNLLTSQIKELNSNEIIQFAIITIPAHNESDINEISLNLAQNHLGDTEKNNGLLLLISITEGLYRFEVGRGIESTFNDAKIGRIGRTYLEPDFTNDQYYQGLSKTITAIENELNYANQQNQQPSTSTLLPTEEKIITNATEPIVSYIFWIGLILIVTMTITSVFSKNKSNKYSNSQYLEAAIIAATLFRKGNNGNGGLGGFGGGSFGGGGATGRF